LSTSTSTSLVKFLFTINYTIINWGELHQYSMDYLQIVGNWSKINPVLSIGAA